MTMLAADMDQLIFAIEMCRDHRMTCRMCLVAELLSQPYCMLYEHLCVHAMALLEDELWPPEDIGLPV